MEQNTCAAKTERNYGIDVLRILSMLMIVMLHIMNQGNAFSIFDKGIARFSVMSLIYDVIMCATNCFGLISGYVGIKSEHKMSSFVLLWLRAVFYGILIVAVFSIFDPSRITRDVIRRSVLPITSNTMWYLTAYFGMFLFLPLINKALNELSNKQIKLIFISFILMLSVMSSVFGDIFMLGDGYSTIWLIVLYILGGCVARLDELNSISRSKAFGCFIAMVLLCWVIQLICKLLAVYFLEDEMSDFAPLFGTLLSYVSPAMLIEALALLITFKNVKISGKAQKIVLFLSQASFSVYIIHCHPLIWTYFNPTSFSVYRKLPIPLTAAAVIFTALVIYLVCSLADIFRDKLFRALKLRQRLAEAEKRLLERFGKDNV